MTGIQDQGRANDISIVGVSGRATSRFHFNRDPEFVVEGIDLVVD